MSVLVPEVRLAGRGGQGVVTAGELLGRAVVGEGRHAQAMPAFGPERRGALSSCTVRISDGEILLKFAAAAPDVLLVLDPTIWHVANVTLGIADDGILIFNSPRSPEEVEDDLVSGRYGYRLGAANARVMTVDATGIGLELLGRPIPNTALMGALTAAWDAVHIDAVERVIREHFGAKAEHNVRAARAGRERLRQVTTMKRGG